MTFVTVIKDNYRISGWLFVFICSVAVVWLSGCRHHSRKEGRIMGRHSARSRVADCSVSTTGMLIGHFRVLLCLCFKASLSAKPFMNTRAKRLRMRKVSICKLAVANANFTTRTPVFELKSNFVSIQNFKAGNVKPLGMHWSKDF